MVEKVVIRDNENSPVRYISDLKVFKNGSEFKFHPGVNIIVGENGSGKSTLLKLIKKYLMVDKTECSFGAYNYNIKAIHRGMFDKLYDGVDVYADYMLNTFRLCHAGERNNEEIQESASAFNEFLTQTSSSVGEGVLVSINSLFGYMFSKEAKLKFDYDEKKDTFPEYSEYVKSHRVTEHNEFTILMDEPDRNLSLKNIRQIKGILSCHKPYTQIICVIHNPLLIYSLSKNKEINFIELTKGYVKKVVKEVDNIIKESKK